jgi:hypothetical protein
MTTPSEMRDFSDTHRIIDVQRSRCTWDEDEDGNWDTTCDNKFTLGDGTPKQNSMHFCCFCGGALSQKLYGVQDPEVL